MQFVNSSTTFLLPSKSPTPLSYAAKANSRGAKLSFAFSSFDQLRSHPVNSTSLSHLSILVQPHQKHTNFNPREVCVSAKTPYCSKASVLVVELPGTAPGSSMCLRCFNAYLLFITCFKREVKSYFKIRKYFKMINRKV